MRRNVADVSCATALASNDLPDPGGPNNMHALGGVIPSSSYLSGYVNGSSTISRISLIYSSSPPISAYVSFGFVSTFIAFTVGSVSST